MVTLVKKRRFALNPFEWWMATIVAVFILAVIIKVCAVGSNADQIVVSAEAGVKLDEAAREVRAANENLFGLAREACKAKEVAGKAEIDRCAEQQVVRAKDGAFSLSWRLIEPVKLDPA